MSTRSVGSQRGQLPLGDRREHVRLGRRELLFGLGASAGSLAFTNLLAAESAPTAGPLAPKEPMLPAKAKACIFLVLEGGPGHMDTFDPKPKLRDLHLTESVRDPNQVLVEVTAKTYYVGSPFGFRKVGKSGIEMCDRFVHMADPAVADELCVYRGCQAQSVNHPDALYHLNTGSTLGADPGVGAWVTYGLGSLNQNVPGYVVMTELAFPQGGAGNWSNGFLPAHYQGTLLRSSGSPVLDLEPPEWKTREQQRRSLDLLADINRGHAERRPSHDELAARMESYELAYRMQAEVPEIVDLSRESEATRDAYGLNAEASRSFGRQCLLARRLVEQGVRFVQIFSGGWDSHDFLERNHAARIASVDKPIAALIRDLRQRGMLDETLVVCSGEFGRTPDNNRRGGVDPNGRGHNADAMAVLMAGGGTPAGTVVGATDEVGNRAVEVVHPLKDLHVTWLRLMGLDDNRLTYFHGGRFKQLSQVGGQLIPELIA